MTDVTVIDSLGYTLGLSRDESIETITFAYNKNIEFLPENVSETYPNLAVFDAAACAIRRISQLNFVNLLKLENIFLDGNRIERIERFTFDGLNSLSEIYLSKKIDFILKSHSN